MFTVRLQTSHGTSPSFSLCQFERRLERDLRETQQQRVAAIERELKRLDRKRLRLNKVLEYEVLNRLVAGNISYHAYILMLLP